MHRLASQVAAHVAVCPHAALLACGQSGTWQQLASQHAVTSTTGLAPFSAGGPAAAPLPLPLARQDPYACPHERAHDSAHVQL
jgi:hypothetical protein